MRLRKSTPCNDSYSKNFGVVVRCGARNGFGDRGQPNSGIGIARLHATREVELPAMIGWSCAVDQVYRLMTNVVDVTSIICAEKVDSGYERVLIRTVPVGYKIGGAAPAARSAAASSSSSVILDS